MSIHPSASLGAEAKVGPDVTLEAGCVIGAGATLGSGCHIGVGASVGAGVTLGRGCYLGPGACLLEGVTLGDEVRVEAGSVIGSCGFGFVFHEGRHLPIPQVAGVVIGSRTRIGPCSCIDRGTTRATRIGSDVEIGAFVQLAHNVVIGDRTRIADQVGVAGSCEVGADCVLEMQAGMAGAAVLGDGSRLGIRGGSTRKSPPGSDLHGFPARPRREALRHQAALQRLPWALEVMERHLASQANDA